MSTTAVATQYIDGHWSTGAGTPFAVIDPTDESTIEDLPSSATPDVEEALHAAQRAQPAWARCAATARGNALRTIADVIEAHADRLAELLVQEVGKPLAQARGEVGFAEGFCRYHAEWDRRLEGEILAGDSAGETIHLLRAPIGVVVAICPWNFPLAVLCRKLAPALVMGNTLVVKASEVTPLATLELFRLIDEYAGLPRGVVNLVAGGREVGQALVDSALTGMVSFTGHRDTGKDVMARASRNLTRVALELGGKAPAIVWEDADLDLAVEAIVEARHANSGQVCTSAERVLVHRDVVEQFTDLYVSAVGRLRLGDPRGDVDMGPLVNAAQLAKASDALALARDEGASIVAGGSRPSGDGFAKGYWATPVVLRDVRPDMRIMIDETFGPITPILAIDSLEEAVRIANDSRYGLSAYVFSESYPAVMETVDALQFGEIYVNRTLGESIHAHHAGYKESGIGGEDGKWGLLRYSQIKTVYHHYGRAPA
jgi:lactaldehyde dehydrogenase / glycolaldehyde dehydrogenase